MFASLFKRSVPKAAAVPEGQVVFAVGDIHGRADLLRALVPAIWKDRGERDGKRPTIIFLGDYIDRGPASDDVLDILIDLQGRAGADWMFLRGNHEQALLDFIEDPEAGPAWGEWGGRETMASYGVDGPHGSDARLWRMARDSLESAMPRAHLAFLRGLPTWHEAGDYFFAHGGARPGVPLDRQSERDLLTIRQPFLQSAKAFEKVVVHGHSIAAEVHSDHRRIGIDTGAYATGTLTAVRLEGDGRRLIQTRSSSEGPEAINVITTELDRAP
jgi:serine/threonine protein phosphatase 1